MEETHGLEPAGGAELTEDLKELKTCSNHMTHDEDSILSTFSVAPHAFDITSNNSSVSVLNLQAVGGINSKVIDTPTAVWVTAAGDTDDVVEIDIAKEMKKNGNAVGNGEDATYGVDLDEQSATSYADSAAAQTSN
jgi:hypothetical protein